MVSTLDAIVFREIRDLILFHLNVIPIYFKMFNLISLFFLHKVGE